MALWVADESAGLMFRGRTLCASPVALCACGDTVACAQMQQALLFSSDTGQELARFALPPGVCRMCALPGALYCVSAEADSLSLFCPRTGQLRLCAQAGCYPRDLQLSPCRRYLTVAGGASGELYVYRAEDLTLLRRIQLPGVVYAAAFAGAQVLALCAVEDSSMQSLLYRISVRGVTEEISRFPGLPGALLSLPDGSMLVSVQGALLRMRRDNRILQRIPSALCSSLRLYPSFVLAADPLAGSVLRIFLSCAAPQTLYRGATPTDMLLI